LIVLSSLLAAGILLFRGNGPGQLIGISMIIGLGGIAAVRLMLWILVFVAFRRYYSVFATVASFGVFLGTSALVLVTSVMNGFEIDLRDKIIGARAHVVVTGEYGWIASNRNVLKNISEQTGVIAASPFVEREAMISSFSNMSGVVLKGVIPRRVQQISDLRAFLVNNMHRERSRYGAVFSNIEQPEELDSSRHNGRRLESRGGSSEAEAANTRAATGILNKLCKDESKEEGEKSSTPQVLIGSELAQSLNIYPGMFVELLAPFAGISPIGPSSRIRRFYVAGIFHSGMYEFDAKYAYGCLSDVQHFAGMPKSEITGFEVRASGPGSAPSLARRLSKVKALKGYKVSDWMQRDKNLFAALQLEKLVMFCVLGFIVLVASMAILSTLMMVVLDKFGEIALLKSMGLSIRRIRRLFVRMGVSVGLSGAIVGIADGILMSLLLMTFALPLDPEVYYISKLPVHINVWEVILILCLTVLMSLLSTLYPAYHASKAPIIDGLRRLEEV